MPSEQPGPRLVLWVDAVGGYLLCLGERIVLGQALPRSNVDVPIMGDLSRRHAAVRRCGEGYVLEPAGTVRIAGRRIETPTVLADGDRIELGSSVTVRFRQPHPLSATARLDLVSSHRTQPSVDGVLMMADSCVLGPHSANHVVCRNWRDDVVLYRQGDRLGCRTLQPIEIDGRRHDGKGPLKLNSRITGEDFALSLEPM